MESILLSEDAKKKIRIVTLLNDLEPGNYTTHYIASLSPFSKQATLYLLDSISEDLEAFFGYHLVDSNRKIPGGSTIIDTNRYHQFLINQSVPYQFVLFVLLNPRKTLDDFCTQQFMSTSSVRRLLKPFLTFLETFEIRINLSSMKIEGNEYDIRLVFNALLWIGSSGRDIIEHNPFRQKHIEVLKKIGFWDCPFINNNEMLTILTIAQLRSENYCPVDSFPLNNHLPDQETKILIQYLLQFLPKPAYLQSELNFLIYCLYYNFLAFDAQDIRISYLEEYIRMEKEQSEDRFWSLFDELIQLVTVEAGIDSREMPTVSSNLSSILLGFYLNHRPLPTKNEISKYETVFPYIYHRSFDFIQAFTKKVARRKGLGWLANVSNELNPYLSYVVKPYLYKKEKVVVAITPLPNFTLMRTLAEFLASFSFVEVVYRDKDDPQVDLFISTFQAFIPETTISTFLVDVKGIPDNTKEQLFKKLYGIYQRKNSN